MNLKKEFHKWLQEHGYDVMANFDNKKLWDEFTTIPSTYKFEENDDTFVLSKTTNLFETEEQRKERRNAEELKAEALEQEYQQWRIDHHRYGSDSMNDYCDFRMAKEKEKEHRWDIEFDEG